jgi:hypothetical protein
MTCWRAIAPRNHRGPHPFRLGTSKAELRREAEAAIAGFTGEITRCPRAGARCARPRQEARASK